MHARAAPPTASRAVEALGLDDMRPTQEVCTELYEWATVTPLPQTLEATA